MCRMSVSHIRSSEFNIHVSVPLTWFRVRFLSHLARSVCFPKGYTFYVEFHFEEFISQSLLVRLSPSLVNVWASKQ